jgi:hypothetical protein
MNTRLLLLALLAWEQPLLAQAPQRTELSVSASSSKASAQVREAVAERWRLPALSDDAFVSVRATVLLSGAVVNPQIDIRGVAGEKRDQVRRSVEQAIGRSVAAAPPGPVEFTIRARAGAYPGRVCGPLKVYVPAVMEDSPEPPPKTSLSGMRNGVERWNRIVVGYGQGKASAPFALVDDPAQADVRVRAFEDYTDYAGYIVDERTGQAIVHVPLKYMKYGLFSSGLRWWSPEVITQQTMFQLGRLLGLSISEEPSNVVYPGHSEYIAPISGGRVLGADAFALEGLRQAAATSLSVSGRMAAEGMRTARTRNFVEEGGTDRTITDFQLDTVLDALRGRTCPRAQEPDLAPQ